MPAPTRLTPKALARLVATLASDGSSGRLIVTHPEGADSVTFAFDGGRICDVAANGTLPDASAMPLRLRSAGLASKEDIEQARAIGQRHAPDRPVTAVAVGGGLVNAANAAAVAESLVAGLLATLAARWDGGTMAFEAGTPTDGLGALVDLHDPEGDIRTELAGMLDTSARIPSMDAVIKFKKGGEGPQQIALEPAGWALLTLVDDRSTLASLARTCGLTDAEALRVACHLLDADLLVVEASRRAEPASVGLVEALASLDAPEIEEPVAPEAPDDSAEELEAPATAEELEAAATAEEQAAEELDTPAAAQEVETPTPAEEPAAEPEVPAAEVPAAEEPAAERGLSDAAGESEEPAAELELSDAAGESAAYEPSIEEEEREAAAAEAAVSGVIEERTEGLTTDAPTAEDPEAPTAEAPAMEDLTAELLAGEEPEEPAGEEPSTEVAREPDVPEEPEEPEEPAAALEPLAAAEEPSADESALGEPAAEEAAEEAAAEAAAEAPAGEELDVQELEIEQTESAEDTSADIPDDAPEIVSLDAAPPTLEQAAEQSFGFDLASMLEAGEEASHALPEISELPEIGEEARLPRSPRAPWSDGLEWPETGLEESFAELGLADDDEDDVSDVVEEWWAGALPDDETVPSDDEPLALEAMLEVGAGVAEEMQHSDAGAGSDPLAEGVALDGSDVQALAVEAAEPGLPEDVAVVGAEPETLEHSLSELALWDDDEPGNVVSGAWFPELDATLETDVLLAGAGEETDAGGPQDAVPASAAPGTEHDPDGEMAQGLAELSAELGSHPLDDAVEPDVVVVPGTHLDDAVEPDVAVVPDTRLDDDEVSGERPASDPVHPDQAEFADLWTSLGINQEDDVGRLHTSEPGRAQGDDGEDEPPPTDAVGASAEAGSEGEAEDLTAITYLEPPEEATTASRPRGHAPNVAASDGAPTRHEHNVEGDRSNIARLFADLAKPTAEPEEDRSSQPRRRKTAEPPVKEPVAAPTATVRKVADPSVDKASLIREFSGLGLDGDNDEPLHFGDVGRRKPQADDKGSRGWFGKRKR